MLDEPTDRCRRRGAGGARRAARAAARRARRHDPLRLARVRRGRARSSSGSCSSASGSSSTARLPRCPGSGTTRRTRMLDARVHAARVRARARSSACSRPAVGFFLVQRQMSLIGDGIGHVAFAGVAAGYLLGISPVLDRARRRRSLGAVAIEWLRAPAQAGRRPGARARLLHGHRGRRRARLGGRRAERQPVPVPVRLDPDRHARRPRS